MSYHPEWDRILTASLRNDPKEIERLVQKEGVSPDHANAVGQSALHIAALWGSVDALQSLIKLGAEPLSRKNQITGGTPLHCAVQSAKANTLPKRIECIKLLIQNGADPLVKDNYDRIPYDYIHERDEIAVEEMKQLLQPKLELWGYLETADLDAMERHFQNPENENAVYVDHEGNTPILFAIKALFKEESDIHNELPTVLNLLFNQSTDMDPNQPDSNGETPLHLLCDRFYQITKKQSTKDAVSQTQSIVDECAQILLSHSTSITQPTQFLFHDAARRGNVPMIQFLLRSLGIDANIRGRQGLTPLHFASRSGMVEAVQVLLGAGADVTIVDDRGKTALDAALVNDKVDVVEVLQVAMDKSSS